MQGFNETNTLQEKCPNTEGPNTGKCGPEKTPYLDTFGYCLKLSLKVIQNLSKVLFEV